MGKLEEREKKYGTNTYNRWKRNNWRKESRTYRIFNEIV
jgi:hypothetical protein